VAIAAPRGRGPETVLLEEMPENAWTRWALGRRHSETRSDIVLPLVLTRGPLEMRAVFRSNVNGRLRVSLSDTTLAVVSVDAGGWQRRRLVASGPASLGDERLSFTLEPDPETSGPSPAFELRHVGVRSERPLFLGPRVLFALLALPLVPAFLVDVGVKSRRARGLLLAVLALAVLGLARSEPLLALIYWPQLFALASLGVAGALWGRTLVVWLWTAFMAAEQRYQTGCPRVAAAVLVPLPAIVVSIWLAATLDTQLLKFSPATPNDEILYWHETATFARVGWSGGYYVVKERPARWSVTHFGAHGPAFPALYGLLGRVLGWREFSGPLFHLLFLAAGLSLYAFLARPSPVGVVLCAAIVATFWPLILYIPSNMQEGLHFALAAAAAGVFAALLGSGGRLGFAGLAALGLTATYAVLLRPSWSLLVPLLILLLPLPARRARLFGFALLLATAGLFWVFVQAASPFPEGGFLFVNGLSNPALLVGNARSNLERVTTGNALERAQWLQCLVLVLVALWRLVAGGPSERRTWAVHLGNVGVLAPMIVVFYTLESGGAFRLLGVGLFLSLLLLAADSSTVSRRLVIALTLVQLAVAPYFSQALTLRARCFPRTPERVAAFRNSVGDRLRYAAGRSPWCNTLVAAHYPYYFREFVAVPAGIGLSMMLGESGPLRSGYVLLDLAAIAATPEATLRSLGGEAFEFNHPGLAPVRLERLAATNVGSLYRNRDLACPE